MVCVGPYEQVVTGWYRVCVVLPREWFPGTPGGPEAAATEETPGAALRKRRGQQLL